MSCLNVGVECGRCHGEIHELLAAHAPKSRQPRPLMPPLVAPVLCGESLPILT
jgi:hypothetical protein